MPPTYSDPVVVDPDEEIPLEIEDFDCATPHEEVAAEIEGFLSSVLSSRAKGATTNQTQQQSLANHRVTHHLVVPGSRVQLEVSLHRDDTTHPIAEWFGLSIFAVIRCKGDASPNLSSSSQYLSYLVTAATNIEVPLPCFTPTGDTFKGSYEGYCSHGPRISRYTLDVFVQGDVPPQCRYMDGLVEMMQLNVGLQSRVCRDTTTGIGLSLDAHRTYRLEPPISVNHDLWHEELSKDNEQCISTAGRFSHPFGPQQCPFDSIHITCRWRGLDEGSVVDNATRSDFDVLAPPKARPPLSSRTAQEEPVSRRCQSLMSVNLRPIGSSAPCHGAEKLSSVAYPFIRHLQELAGAHSLETNHDDEDGLPQGGADRSTSSEIRSAMEECLDSDMVLPHAVTNKYIRSLWREGRGEGVEKGSIGGDIRYRFVPNSLLSRFAHTASHLEHSDDVMAAWLELVEQLRTRFNAITTTHDIPTKVSLCDSLAHLLGMMSLTEDSHDGLPVPDLDAPILVQKVQMLWYCLKRLQSDPTLQLVCGQSPNAKWGSDDELSFYSVDDEEEDEKTEVVNKGDAVLHDEIDVAFEPLEEEEERVAEAVPTHGMLRINGGTVAIPLEIPLEGVIRPMPKTLDELEAEQAALLKLGTGKQGQQTRLWLQSQPLRDDMSRFKAANMPVPHPRDPSTLVEPSFIDFVRWHSPKDYTGPAFDPKTTPLSSSEDRLAALSEASSLPIDAVLSRRMSTPGNVWLSMWESAPPVEPTNVFVPESALDLLFSWLSTEASQEEIHLVVVIYNASNLAHRIACHPACISASLPSSSSLSTLGGNDDNYALLQGLLREKLTEMGTIAFACTSSAAQNAYAHLQEVEVVRGKCSQLVRCLREFEYAVGLVMACCAALQSPKGDEAAQVEIAAIASRLACSTFMDKRSVAQGAAEGSGIHKLSHTLIPPNLFWGNILQLLPVGSQPVLKRSVLRCLAERPMNSEATPQRLLMDVDANGLHRIAFCLAEEIP